MQIFYLRHSTQSATVLKNKKCNADIIHDAIVRNVSLEQIRGIGQEPDFLRISVSNIGASSCPRVSFFLPDLLRYQSDHRWCAKKLKHREEVEVEPSVEAIFRGQSRMTARGQITVPMEVRKKFGLKPGDSLCFLEVEGSIVLKLGPLILTQE